MGFVGPRHARSTDFVTSPFASLRYLVDLFRGRARRHVGHSPAGGAMVLVLLVTPVALVGTGLQVYAVEEDAGLLAGWAATTASPTLTLPAAAGDDGSVVEVGGGEQGQAEGGVWGEMQ
jgi:cytochrome b